MFSVKVVYSALLKEQKEKGTAREWAEANKKSDSERAQAVQHKLFTMVKRHLAGGRSSSRGVRRGLAAAERGEG